MINSMVFTRIAQLTVTLKTLPGERWSVSESQAACALSFETQTNGDQKFRFYFVSGLGHWRAGS